MHEDRTIDVTSPTWRGLMDWRLAREEAIKEELTRDLSDAATQRLRGQIGLLRELERLEGLAEGPAAGPDEEGLDSYGL